MVCERVTLQIGDRNCCEYIIAAVVVGVARGQMDFYKKMGNNTPMNR